MNETPHQPSAAGGNVIALWRRKETMSNPIVTDVIKYWEGLRAARAVPARTEIDPRAIQDALSYAFIVERSRPGVVRVRLSGTHLNELMGMEVRGMPVRAFFELSDRKRLMELVESVFVGPCHLDLDLVSDGQGRSVLDGRMILLPLSDATGEVNRALGAFVTDGQIGLPPRRFRIRRTSLTPLQPGRPLLGAASPYRPAHPPGLEEDGEPYRGPDQRQDGPDGGDRPRPTLRVVSGGKT